MNAAVVDTNVLITFLEKGNKVCELLSRFDRLLVPAAVDAEFRAGIDLATDSGMRRSQVWDDFLADSSVEFLSVGREESLKYAMLYRVLKENGTPIPINDIWIASSALVRNVPVCTFDPHFRRVPLLQVLFVET